MLKLVVYFIGVAEYFTLPPATCTFQPSLMPQASATPATDALVTDTPTTPSMCEKTMFYG